MLSKQKYVTLSSPSTRFKTASRHTYNQLTELLIEGVPQLSLDIGGSLIKISVFIPDICKFNFKVQFEKYYCKNLSFKNEYMKGKFLFFIIPTEELNIAIDFINQHGFPYNKARKSMRATGGGAFKFKNILLQKTKFQSIDIIDEMSSLRSGLLFLNTLKIKDETFTLDSELGNKKSYPRNWIYPALLVQIGSGISFIKLDAEEYVRVDGSGVGGATYVGLSKMFNQLENKHEYNYKNAIEQAEQGMDANTLFVNDIYGKGYCNVGADIPAAFFGKIRQYNESDCNYNLLQMICFNIGHISVLNAKLLGLKRIIFSGSFNNQLARKLINESVMYYTANTIQSIFLEHDSVLGSIGAMLGNEIEYVQVKDAIGLEIEKTVEDLESISESEKLDANIHFQ